MPGGFPFEDAGKDFYEISFFAGSGVTALSRLSSVKENSGYLLRRETDLQGIRLRRLRELFRGIHPR